MKFIRVYTNSWYGDVLGTLVHVSNDKNIKNVAALWRHLNLDMLALVAKTSTFSFLRTFCVWFWKCVGKGPFFTTFHAVSVLHSINTVASAKHVINWAVVRHA